MRLTRSVVVVVGKQRYTYAVDPFKLQIVNKHLPVKEKRHPRNVLRMAYCLYKYTLRLSRVSDMKKLHAVDSSEITDIKNSIFSSYDMVTYKLATIKCVLKALHPTRDWEKIGDIFESYGIDRNDRILYCFLYHNKDISLFIDMLKGVQDGVGLSEDSLRKEVDEGTTAYRRMRNAASSYASKKLTFIAKGNRFESKDMARDLLMRGIQAYYWVRPFYSKAHAINYACSAMKGWALCLIEYYTDPVRARVYTTPDGYENAQCLLEADAYYSDGFNEDAMLMYVDFMRSCNGQEATI